jgi:hypothetical protein
MRSSRVYTREAEDKRDMCDRLEDTEISIVNYVAQDEGIAYSNLEEFRDIEELSSQTVSRNLKYTTQTQAIRVIVAGSPGYNTAVEMFVSKKSRGKAILSERGPVSTLRVNKGDNID